MLSEAVNDGDRLVLSREARVGPPVAWAAIALLSLAALALVVYAGQVVLLERLRPGQIAASVAGAAAPLRPETPIHVSATGQGVEVQGARLFRADAATSGPARREQPVAVRLQPVAGEEGGYQVVAADGTSALRPDGAYRLLVQIATQRPGLPLPRAGVVEREYRFTTVASPRPAVSAEPLRAAWASPVPLDWSAPMQSVAVRARPQVPVRAWVDPQTPTRTWVQLGDAGGQGLAAGETYEVTVLRAEARDGIALQAPASFAVATPPRPRFVDLPGDPVTVRAGGSVTFTASTELAEARVESLGDLPIATSVEGARVRVDFPRHVQGQQVTLRLAGATSVRGAPLAESAQVQVRTPAALAAPLLAPGGGEGRVAPATRPSITFAETVTDRAAAERAIRLEPEVAGRWQWTAANRVEFVPDGGRLPARTELTLSVQGGPSSLRSHDGGYLEEDAVAAFTTTTPKEIDIDLSRQLLHMLEDEKVIRTIVVGTGVRGAETPTGEYEVLYKMAKTRMQGVNPSGVRYDLPDVPWVLPFWGDYAIHGNYWRSSFGTVGSNGCVGMSVAEAKIVYDWADVGTPISIHY